jgi:energy-coupling factor transporter ATP-binding protein EcfA2
LARALIACEAARIPALIVLNKRDLAEEFADASARLSTYAAMGYSVLSCGLKGEQREADLAVLRERMNGLTSLVLGPSGGGKSTFINALVPDASLQTAEISQALNSGKHTTTSTSWFAWNQAGHAVWPAPHRSHRTGRPHARFARPPGPLQVPQLQPLARARLWCALSCGRLRIRRHHARAACAVHEPARRIEPAAAVVTFAFVATIYVANN